MSRQEVRAIRIDHEEPIDVEMVARDRSEFIIVCDSGSVFLFDWESQQHRQLGQLDFPITYDTENFEWLNKHRHERSPLRVISHRNYVCIAQTYGQTGTVLELDEPEFKLPLNRGDYNVEHCSFPLAFYSRDDDTFLIHGTDWNRLDITDLKSGKNLTERLVDYESKSNYFAYFHSSLSMSPDSKRFASNGWFWGPCDVITVYEVDGFLSKFELANTQLDFGPVDGYNWDRPMCWIDEQRIGVGYNKEEAYDEKRSFPSEILIVDTVANQIVDRVEFDGFARSEYGAPTGDLYFEPENGWFISTNSSRGLLVADRNGGDVLSDRTLVSHKYSVSHRCLYRLRFDECEVEIIEL